MKRTKTLFSLTAILFGYSLILFILSCFGIRPINKYLGMWTIASLAAILACLSIIAIIRKKLVNRNSLKNGLTITVSLLALFSGAVCAFYIWSVTIFGSDTAIFVSPDGNRKIVVEKITSIFRHHYTAYPVVFPGFYRLQGSGYIYLGENTGTAHVKWEEDKAIVTIEPFGGKMWDESPVAEKLQIIVDFTNPEPWKPLTP